MKQIMKFLMLALLFISCVGGEFKESKTFIGNQVVDARTLNLGKQVYLEYCMACHGEKGDGNGPAARGSVPPPRNFTQGLYKFGWVKDGGLPTDDDFKRIIQHGLNGTAMFKWDISDKQTYAVTQYIKTFAPDTWENLENTKGEPIEVGANPYVGRETFATKKGREVYHVVANCQACHRAYATKSEMSSWNKKYNGEAITYWDDDMYLSKLQESEYYFWDSKDRTAKFVPPDFSWHHVRSVRQNKNGEAKVDDIYKRLVAGVTGTSMPAWRDTISDEDIWAVSYYVKSLMEIKDSEQREEILKNWEK